MIVVKKPHPDPAEVNVAQAAEESREEMLLSGESGEEA